MVTSVFLIRMICSASTRTSSACNHRLGLGLGLGLEVGVAHSNPNSHVLGLQP